MIGGMGDEPGNLGNLPMGTLVVSSPPFADSVGSDDPAKRGGLLVSDPKRAKDTNLTGSYGASEGQLGVMVAGSPPYENSLDRGTVDKQMRVDYARQNGKASAADVSPIDLEKIGGRNQPDYGSTPNQLGNSTGETFWSAASLIVHQCALILPPRLIRLLGRQAVRQKRRNCRLPGSVASPVRDVRL